MKYKYFLAFDPSGSFDEGKGTTGWVLMDYAETLIDKGAIYAEDFKCKEEYWNAHIDLIRHCRERYGKDLLVVIEEYLLYRDRYRSQTNSKMETCRLIGLMQWYCWSTTQCYSMQTAASVKDRWSDDLLIREGIIRKDRSGKYVHITSNYSLALGHTRDAFRHAIHYIVCRNNKEEKQPYKKYYKGAYNGKVRHHY